MPYAKFKAFRDIKELIIAKECQIKKSTTYISINIKEIKYDSGSTTSESMELIIKIFTLKIEFLEALDTLM